MEKEKKYVIFNKPYGVICQFTPEVSGQKTLAEFALPKDIYPVGRLDLKSEGLVLLSNDGVFIKNFLDHHMRRYWVQVEGNIDNTAINSLVSGIKIQTGKTKPCFLNLINPPIYPERDPPIRVRKLIPTSWIEIYLTEGKFHQIRRMTAKVGFPTLRLIRSGLGNFLWENQPVEPGQFVITKKAALLSQGPLEK